MPVIGVTINRQLVDGRHWQGCPESYVQAVISAGGCPLLLPSDAIPSFLPHIIDRLDGLLLSGGGDLEPRIYDQDPHPATEAPDTSRDRAELGLVGAVLEAGLPVLGICRGIQVLNVALGGDLIQHLPSAGHPGHYQSEARDVRTHAVLIERGTPLAELTPGEVMVNSFHHQGVGRLGRGLAVAGRHPDGLVEAVWLPGRPVLAVQWHPECYAGLSEDAANLFQWLTREAEERAERASKTG